MEINDDGDDGYEIRESKRALRLRYRFQIDVDI